MRVRTFRARITTKDDGPIRTLEGARRTRGKAIALPLDTERDAPVRDHEPDRQQDPRAASTSSTVEQHP